MTTTRPPGNPSYRDELNEVPNALLKLSVMANSENRWPVNDIAKLLAPHGTFSVYGMASSQWAAWPMVSIIRDHTPFWVEWGSSYDGLVQHINGFANRRPTILVSQSGRTVETCDLARNLKSTDASIPLVAVTNNLGSPLARIADTVLDIGAGAEMHAPTKSYVNTVATLLVLADALQQIGTFRMNRTSSTLASIAGILPTYLSSSDAWASDVMAATEDGLRSNYLYFLAGGAQLGSAWQSSMLYAETARHRSAVADWATFRHGFEPQVDAGFLGIGFEPPPRENRQTKQVPDVVMAVASSIAHRRGTIRMVPQLDAGRDANHLLSTEYWRPLWETLPVHHLCMRLATAKGLDAGEIERKVTEDYV